MIAAKTNPVAEVASHASPVSVGEYPSTCCMNSDPRKMNVKKAPKAKNAIAFETRSERSRRTEPGTSGSGARRSTRTKLASSTPASAEEQQRRGRAPAVVRAAVQGVDQGQQAAGHRDGARGVEPTGAVSPVVARELRGGERRAARCRWAR